MERTEPLQVFVYGTLKPEHVNFELFCAGLIQSVAPALTKGRLYQIPFYSDKYPRGYPAMTSEEGWVEGYLLQFKNVGILEKLDRLEGYKEGRSPEENEYQRQRIQIFTPDKTPLTKAWGYIMTIEHVQELQGTALNKTVW
ncbi:AIG2 family protein [[Leptolyngbya] sp. PCC 7376]|uniref:gamma-glutamylcyclotransferase family protein n=1 Tax=[Leptolyngbya] sp. PCC 7376 TaxID=111781 RepID=UPI00029EC530|nr:gamma-glutamylcyclotransferase family protein [[Leptolyngbya] sp. PCC 7376]AFY38500.1 AIG2 family protein [[Leptolyngbya] sp. PCC 7376]